MLKTRYLVGFTGHRSGFDEAIIRPVLTRQLTALQERARAVGGQAELYASIAEGADVLCVEIARSLEMPVHLLLPLPEAEFARDFTHPESWARSAAQLALARQRPGRDSVHLAPGEPTRPECYFNQGMHMLEAVDVLVALWDGAPARGLGGTEQIIAQAQAMGLPVVQIAAATGEVGTHGDLAARFLPDPISSELAAIAAASGKAGATAASTPDALQSCLGEIAIHEADNFRPSLVRIIVLHAVAALLATIVTFKLPGPTGVWENSRWMISFAELLLVSYALWMGWRIHRKHTQERWIRCRFATELVRGLRSSVPLLDPLQPLVTRHDPKWRRFALSVGLLVHEHQPTSDPLQLRDQYLAVRLSDTHPDGQIRHYEEMRPRALRWWHFTGLVSTWSAVLAPLFVLFSLLNKLSGYLPHGHAWHLDEKPLTWPFVVFLPIALPLIAGAANGVRHALDASRRKDRYPQMAARLTELRRSLAGLRTASTIQAAVARSEDLLLDELLEWQLAMKNTGH